MERVRSSEVASRRRRNFAQGSSEGPAFPSQRPTSGAGAASTMRRCTVGGGESGQRRYHNADPRQPTVRWLSTGTDPKSLAFNIPQNSSWAMRSSGPDTEFPNRHDEPMTIRRLVQLVLPVCWLVLGIIAFAITKSPIVAYWLPWLPEFLYARRTSAVVFVVCALAVMSFLTPPSEYYRLHPEVRRVLRSTPSVGC